MKWKEEKEETEKISYAECSSGLFYKNTRGELFLRLRGPDGQPMMVRLTSCSSAAFVPQVYSHGAMNLGYVYPENVHGTLEF